MNYEQKGDQRLLRVDLFLVSRLKSQLMHSHPLPTRAISWSQCNFTFVIELSMSICWSTPAGRPAPIIVYHTIAALTARSCERVGIWVTLRSVQQTLGTVNSCCTAIPDATKDFNVEGQTCFRRYTFWSGAVGSSCSEDACTDHGMSQSYVDEWLGILNWL